MINILVFSQNNRLNNNFKRYLLSIILKSLISITKLSIYACGYNKTGE